MNNSTDPYDLFGTDLNWFDPRQNRFKVRVQLVANCITMFIAVIGNALVVAVIKQKANRCINDLFIVNLAISDVLFVAVSLLLNIFFEMFPGSLSLFHCAALRPLGITTFCLSIFTVTSMAIVRCRIKCYPYRPRIRRRTVYYWIATLWLLSVLVSLPAMHVAKVTPRGRCTGKWASKTHKDAYIICLLLLKCILPLIKIRSAYVKIAIFLMQNKGPQTSLNGNRASNYRDGARKENLQIAEMLAAIVLLFGLCTSPHQVAWMLKQFGEEKETSYNFYIFRSFAEHAFLRESFYIRTNVKTVSSGILEDSR